MLASCVAKDKTSEPMVAMQLKAVITSTINSFMGRDVDHNIVDLLSRIGLLQERERATVIFTRARTSLIRVGPAEGLLNDPINRNQLAIRLVIRYLTASDEPGLSHYVTVKERDVARYDNHQMYLNSAFSIRDEDEVPIAGRGTEQN